MLQLAAALLCLQAEPADVLVVNFSTTHANNKIGVQRTPKWEIAASGDTLVRIRYDEKRVAHLGSTKLGKGFWAKAAELLPEALPDGGPCGGVGGCTDPARSETCSQHAVRFRLGKRSGSRVLCDKAGAGLAKLFTWIEGVGDGAGGGITPVEALDVYLPDGGGFRKAVAAAGSRAAAMKSLLELLDSHGGLLLPGELARDGAAVHGITRGPLDEMLKAADEAGQLEALRCVEAVTLKFGSKERAAHVLPRLTEMQGAGFSAKVREAAKLTAARLAWLK